MCESKSDDIGIARDNCGRLDRKLEIEGLVEDDDDDDKDENDEEERKEEMGRDESTNEWGRSIGVVIKPVALLCVLILPLLV